MERYDPQQIESKWQQVWAQTNLYQTTQDPDRKNYYALVMFPYPSGDLHSGHWYNFGPGDTIARYHRMRGQNVLHPMGFDAFGLPAENAAIKRNIPPAQWTEQNITRMTGQLKALGAMYDWELKVDTSKPDYYRWTQWLFLFLYKHDLAYRAKGWQNWCPKDQTVLANEQTISESGEKNVCVRCGTPVVKKELEQWFFKITDYADRLLADLDKVEWPEKVKIMQENWIGRSEGALIEFRIANHESRIEVFTTRPDTLFGATYMVLAPEHPLVEEITTKEQQTPVVEYQKQVSRETELDRLEEKEKTGVFTGAYAINPINDEKIPIWIADYVLMSYGTGAIMAVPAHDERDNEFAQKFDLPIKTVVEPVLVQVKGSAAFRENQPVQDSDGIIAIVKHWSKDLYLGLEWPKAGWGTLLTGGIDPGHTPEQTVLKEISEETGFKNAKIVKQLGVIHSKYYHEPKKANRFGHAPTFYVELQDDVRDVVSDEEQSKHKLHWLTLNDLKNFLTATSHLQALELMQSRIYTGLGLLTNSKEFNGLQGNDAKRVIVEHLYKNKQGKGNTRYRLRDWLISRQRYWGAPIPIVYCDKCGTVPVPEQDLPVELPLDVEFEPTGQSPLEKRPDFVETKCPSCGGDARRETDTMDTFVDSSWYFLRYPNPKYDQGPFDPQAVKRWLPVDQYMGGVEHAILHLLYARFVTKALFDQKLIEFDEPFKRLFNQGLILGPDGQKMSKSRGNVVSPDDWVSKYGADTFRMYLMFMGPYDQGGPFDTKGIAGVYRYLGRVWQFGLRLAGGSKAKPPESTGTQGAGSTALARIIHQAIRDAGRNIQEFKFNLAVSTLMETLNHLQELSRDYGLEHRADWSEAWATYLKLLAPLAPHLSEELWQQQKGEGSVHVQVWPEYDPELIKDDLIEVIVQVNGKLRGTLTLPADASEKELESAAKNLEPVQRHLDGKPVTKTIVVPRKLVNFVVEE